MAISVDLGNVGIALVGAFVGAYWAFYKERKHRPNLNLELIPRWLDRDKGLLVVRMQVSSQHFKYVKIESIIFKSLEHPLPIVAPISEFISFDKAERVFTTTKKLEPGEIIIVERLIKCSQQSIIQLGLQAKTCHAKDSWTTTCFVS